MGQRQALTGHFCGSHFKPTRQSEAAYEVKSRVIEAIIHSYKSISKDEVKTAWRT